MNKVCPKNCCEKSKAIPILSHKGATQSYILCENKVLIKPISVFKSKRVDKIKSGNFMFPVYARSLIFDVIGRLFFLYKRVLYSKYFKLMSSALNTLKTLLRQIVTHNSGTQDIIKK